MNDPVYSLEAYAGYLHTVKSKNTTLKYIDSARHFLSFCEEKKLAFDRLPPNALREFVSWLSAKDLAPRSIHVYVAGAKNYLRWCEGQGLTGTRLAADLPKAPPPVPGALRDDLILGYLREASKLHEPFRTCLLLLPYTGLRGDEMATLPLLAAKIVELPLRGTNERRAHLCLVVRGKGQEVRVVPVLLDGVVIFQHYMRNWRQHVAAPDWMFPGPSGSGPISTRMIRHYVQLIRDRVPGASKLTPHTLRDTYATTLWKCGVDPITITKAMGHRNVQTTYNHYLDIQEGDVAGTIVQRNARLVVERPSDQRRPELVDYLRRTASERMEDP